MVCNNWIFYICCGQAKPPIRSARGGYMKVSPRAGIKDFSFFRCGRPQVPHAVCLWQLYENVAPR